MPAAATAATAARTSTRCRCLPACAPWAWASTICARTRLTGRAAAAEQRDLLLRHAERVEAQIKTLRTHLDYLRDKAAVWDARDRGDELAEAQAWERVRVVVERMEVAR
jgi:hypothetical protein